MPLIKMLIGLLGRQGVGKDLIASYLIARYGYQKRSIAEPLKEGSRIIFGLSQDQVDGPSKDIIDQRFSKTPREILQHLGTNVIRKVYGHDFFIDQALNLVPPRTVISDLRFQNEVWKVKQRGGLVIKVIRPGIRQDEHPSETGIDLINDHDYLLINDQTQDELYKQLDRLILKEGIK